MSSVIYIIFLHYIDEVLYGVGMDYESGDIKYALDQLSSAQMEVNAESTDITDKKGNIIRTTYRAKTGTFTCTSALLHPAALNAQSGSDLQYASTAAPIQMPVIYIVEAGKAIDVSDCKEGTARVIGLYGNGANSEPLDANASKNLIQNNKFTAPAAAEGAPIQYLITYERDVTSGIKLSNNSSDFPALSKLVLFCSYGDPCKDDLKPCYVVVPRFAADPSMTISLDAETQEVDFSGNMNIDYCAGTSALYYIYYPDEDLVLSGIAAE